MIFCRFTFESILRKNVVSAMRSPFRDHIAGDHIKPSNIVCINCWEVVEICLFLKCNRIVVFPMEEEKCAPPLTLRYTMGRLIYY